MAHPAVVRSNWVALLLPACWLITPLSAATSETRSEFWPELDTYVGLTDNSRLFFQYTATREDELRTYADGQVAAFFDFYLLPLLGDNLREHPDASRRKVLTFRVGYAYSRTPSTDAKPASSDHIPTLEATARLPLPWGVHLTDRNRGDLRFMNGAFIPRYRNTLRFERIFKAGRSHFTPYADAEVFYDCRYDNFNVVRYSAGMEWAPIRLVTVDTYYTRQRDTTSSPEYVNALGLKLQFYLRNNPK